MNKTFKYTFVSGVMALLFPALTFAAVGNGKTLKDLIATISGYFNDILALMMGVAVLMFVYYVIKYFLTPNDQRTEGAQYVMYSLLGFFIILSVWGLVNILLGTFDLNQSSPSNWNNLFNMVPK